MNKAMKYIKVLGNCCSSCDSTIALIEQVAGEMNVAVSVQKIEDLREVMSYGIMSMPGVVIDGTVMHAGGLPVRAKIEQWFAD